MHLYKIGNNWIRSRGAGGKIVELDAYDEEERSHLLLSKRLDLARSLHILLSMS